MKGILSSQGGFWNRTSMSWGSRQRTRASGCNSRSRIVKNWGHSVNHQVSATVDLRILSIIWVANMAAELWIYLVGQGSHLKGKKHYSSRRRKIKCSEVMCTSARGGRRKCRTCSSTRDRYDVSSVLIPKLWSWVKLQTNEVLQQTPNRMLYPESQKLGETENERSPSAKAERNRFRLLISNRWYLNLLYVGVFPATTWFTH